METNDEVVEFELVLFSEKDQQRFFEKTQLGPKVEGLDKPCLVWTAAKSGGYGCFSFERRPRGAHRFAYFMENGKWPKSLAHRCDNPSCVEITHLEDVSHVKNMRDKMLRSTKEWPTRKLTAEAVREIRCLLRAGCSVKHLAERFCVSKTTIYGVKSGRYWGYVH